MFITHLNFFPLTIMFDQEQYEYDDMDLGQPSEQFHLGEPKLIKSLSSLINRIETKQSYP